MHYLILLLAFASVRSPLEKKCNIKRNIELHISQRDTFFFILERHFERDQGRDLSKSRYIDSTENACFNEFMCRSQVELLVKKPWNALRAIFNALWSVASCTNSRRQTTLRPISMSTTAWNGVHFRTIVVYQNQRKQPHTSELISSLRGACNV